MRFLATLVLLLTCAVAEGVPPAIRLPGNAAPPSPEEMSLGQKLFNSKLLSVDGTVSCASCHKDSAGGADTVPLAIGIQGRQGIFNTPTVFDAVYPSDTLDAPRMFRNARTSGLGTQALEPIIAINEMGNPTEVSVLARIYNDPSLRNEFAQVFGDKAFATTQVPTFTQNGAVLRRRRGQVQSGTQTVTHVNRDAYSRAFVAFESTLVTPHNSPYDKHMNGDDSAMSPLSKMGLGIFFSSGCSSCHTPPLFKDRYSHNNGMNFASTKQLGQVGDGQTRRFMTANLRRAAETPPYAFDGSFPTLERVVDHYDAGGEVILNGIVQKDPQQDPLVRRLNLTPMAKAALVEFIRSLAPEPGTSPRIELP